jgi:DNA-binding IclR family transcriptional regulator
MDRGESSVAEHNGVAAGGQDGLGTAERDHESPIKSVRKAIDVLDILADARRPLRVGEIATKLSMSVSAVSRLVATLSRGALVHQEEETGRCYLGLGLTVLGADALGRRSLDRIALPIMDEVASRVCGYVSLSRLARGKVVFMRALPAPLSQHGVNLTVVVPMHACAPGKILCGGFTAAEILDLLKAQGMDPITAHTITQPAQFLAAVEAARMDGFAVDDQETAYKHRHVACPIFDHNGNVVAALSGGGALTDFQWSELPALIQALSHGSLRISRELGYLGEANVNLGALNAVFPIVPAVPTPYDTSA